MFAKTTLLMLTKNLLLMFTVHKKVNAYICLTPKMSLGSVLFYKKVHFFTLGLTFII